MGAVPTLSDLTPEQTAQLYAHAVASGTVSEKGAAAYAATLKTPEHQAAALKGAAKGAANPYKVPPSPIVVAGVAAAAALLAWTIYRSRT